MESTIVKNINKYIVGILTALLVISGFFVVPTVLAISTPVMPPGTDAPPISIPNEARTDLPQGTLLLKKHVINDDGGFLMASNFTLHVKTVGNPEMDIMGSPTTGSEGGIAFLVSPGTYKVSEDVPPSDYVLQPGFGPDCDGTGMVTIAAGETKTCIITNDDIAMPQLVVQKWVVNHGGMAMISDFNLFVGFMPVTSGSLNSFSPGSYMVSEIGSLGYTATFGGDCTADGEVTLVSGQPPKLCTITNEQAAAASPWVSNMGTSYNGCSGVAGAGQGVFYWTYNNPTGISQKNFEFRVALATDPTFSNPPFVIDRFINGTSTQQSVFIYQPHAANALQYNTSYDWQVRVCDTQDACSSWTDGGLYIRTGHPSPFPSFAFSPVHPSPNQQVSFSDHSICYSNTGQTACQSWLWNFGDGQPANQQNPTHAYAGTGNFSVLLQASDGVDTCSTQGSITVSSPNPSQGGSSSGPAWKEVSPLENPNGNGQQGANGGSGGGGFSPFFFPSSQ
jgi:hypothetical protein